PAKMKQTVDNRVQEETITAYFQVELNGDLGDMPSSVLTGSRYGTTDVTSSSVAAGYRSIWESNNDVAIRVDSNQEASLATAEASYDNLLPSLDIRLDISDNLVGRFSASKTIARAGLGSLGVSASGFGAGGGSSMLS